MNSTNIKKFKYADTSNNPISLLEYLILNEDDNPYILFKFHNNLNQELESIYFSLLVYDKNQNLIESFKLNVEGLSVKANEAFIPEIKAKINKDVVNIKYELISATFKESIYKDNKYLRKDNEEDIVKKINGKNQIKVIDRYKHAPIKTITILTGVLMFMFVVLTIAGAFFYTDKFANKFAVNGSEYIVLNDEAYLAKAPNNVESFEIPVEVSASKFFKNKTYRVTGIYNEAFKDSNIKYVTLSNYVNILPRAFVNSMINEINNSAYILRIEDEAFKNCDYLEQLELINNTFIGKNAFESCDKLTRLISPKAGVASEAFKGDKLTDLTFDNVLSGKPLYTIFDNRIKDVSKSINDIKIYIARLRVSETLISIDYFHYTSITRLNISTKTSVTFGALCNADHYFIGNARYDQNHEYLDDIIVSTK